MVRPIPRGVLPLLFALLAFTAGCNDDDDKPTSPQPAVTLDRLWPNDDGRYWQYDVVTRGWVDTGGDTFATAAQVPPAPSPLEVLPLIDSGIDVPGATTSSSWYELRFMGTIRTGSGVTKQNLYETHVLPDLAQPARPRGFYGQLERARPDLRPQLRAMLASIARPADTAHYSASVMLHGYAWEKTSQWIGTYGDADTLLAWKYLTWTLNTGAQFSHQLVPSLASDVWLRARVSGRRNITTPAGTFMQTVMVVYVVDYGVSAWTDSGGNPVGYGRNYGFGAVWYAPDVGPVAAYERMLLATGGPPSIGIGDVSLSMSNRGPVLLTARPGF
jgi:hypothetical protein